MIASQHEAASPENSSSELVAMVRRTAARLMRRLPAHVDRDELVGAGFLGLAKALRRFDAERFVSLTDFAEHRVRGEMLDELRRMDPLSRYARGAIKRRQQVIDGRRSQGLEAEPEAVAGELGISLAHLRSIERDVAQDGVFTDALSSDVPDRGPDPFDEACRSEVRAQLVAALERLPSTERLVLQLRFIDEQPLRQIGELLGVTASRVCQIQAEALRNLRAVLGSPSDLALAS